LQETRVLLLRHAETSAPDVFHGAESDIGLSDRGRRQAVVLAEHLNDRGACVLYSSAMRRAVDTAALIGAACGLTPVILPALHERKIGPLSGLARDEGWSIYAESKGRWIAGDLEYTHEGGESFADIRRRVLPVFQELLAAHRGQTVIVVAHGIVIRVLLTTLLADLPPAEFDQIAIDFASINELAWDGERWRAEALNRVVAPSPARPVA
jgi:broad specificity phosphatase PhoE